MTCLNVSRFGRILKPKELGKEYIVGSLRRKRRRCREPYDAKVSSTLTVDETIENVILDNMHSTKENKENSLCRTVIGSQATQKFCSKFGRGRKRKQLIPIPTPTSPTRIIRSGRFPRLGKHSTKREESRKNPIKTARKVLKGKTDSIVTDETLLLISDETKKPIKRRGRGRKNKEPQVSQTDQIENEIPPKAKQTRRGRKTTKNIEQFKVDVGSKASLTNAQGVSSNKSGYKVKKFLEFDELSRIQGGPLLSGSINRIKVLSGPPFSVPLDSRYWRITV